MWFKADRRAGGATRQSRPSRQFGSRTLETLEGRALLSHLGPITRHFTETNLVSDGLVPAAHTDPKLVNPWGIAFGPATPFWVADNGMGVATVYNGTGTPQSRVVTIPPPAGGTTAAPTGEVFNNTNRFVVTEGNKQGASVFIFATEDGTISGWNPKVDQSNAILKVDNSSKGAVYKGLAEAKVHGKSYLYATNFHAGTIDVFDQNFNPVPLDMKGFGTFQDPNAPPPPIGSPGYSPFGIQLIGNKLFVTYALQDQDQHDDVEGDGNGFIDEFDTTGHFIQRFATGSAVTGGNLDALNSPWGMTLAPTGFFRGQGQGRNHQGQDNNGVGSHVLLVGNFGNSHVSAFDVRTGAFLGQLTDSSGAPLVLTGGFMNTTPGDTKGLWGLRFGGGGQAGNPNTLFFTAGINDENNGLFGSVTPVR